MATAKKATETETKTTTKKTTTTKKAADTSEVDALKAQIEAQNKAMAEMMEKMKAMTEQMENTSQPQIQIVRDRSAEDRKVKVVSCVDCFLNLTTGAKGSGLKYEFPRFGTSHNIKMSNLEKCVHEHRNSFLRGDCYICDPDAVAELGLSEAYEKLYDVDALNDIIKLAHGETDVERICGMGTYDPYTQEFIDTSARDKVIDAIATNMAKGVYYDRNLIYKLSEKLGIDLDAKAAKAKEVLALQNNH